MPITVPELLVAVREFVATREGRIAIRGVLREVDRRVGADKSGHVHANPPAPVPDEPPATRAGRYLAQLRVSRGLTQPEVAAKIDVNVRSIVRWERGQTAPDLNTYARWAAALGSDLVTALEAK